MKHAFPFIGEYYKTPGMTLREYYAGQVLAGIMANPNPVPLSDTYDAHIITRCLELAAKLCEALEQSEP